MMINGREVRQVTPWQHFLNDEQLNTYGPNKSSHSNQLLPLMPFFNNADD